MDEIIEPEIGRKFPALVSEDDFSAAGQIPYRPPQVNGEETDMTEFAETLQAARGFFAAASDRLPSTMPGKNNHK
jgi:hypothetical protein